MNILMYAVLRVPAEVVGMCRFYTMKFNDADKS